MSLEYYHLEELIGMVVLPHYMMVVLKGSGTWQSVRVLSRMCIAADTFLYTVSQSINWSCLLILV